MRYDADQEPKAETWLQLDESEQLDVVLRFHKGMGLKGERAQLHAIVHTAIENQLAGGHRAARGALDRLVAEGLTRPEAVHAIGMPFSEQMLSILKEQRPCDAEEYELLSASSRRHRGEPLRRASRPASKGLQQTVGAMAMIGAPPAGDARRSPDYCRRSRA